MDAISFFFWVWLGKIKGGIHILIVSDIYPTNNNRNRVRGWKNKRESYRRLHQTYKFFYEKK